MAPLISHDTMNLTRRNGSITVPKAFRLMVTRPAVHFSRDSSLCKRKTGKIYVKTDCIHAKITEHTNGISYYVRQSLLTSLAMLKERNNKTKLMVTLTYYVAGMFTSFILRSSLFNICLKTSNVIRTSAIKLLKSEIKVTKVFVEDNLKRIIRQRYN